MAQPPQPTRLLREELGIPEGSTVIGTLARLDRQKVLDDMLRATALVREQCSNVTLLIAGDGPLHADLRALARELRIEDSVHFLGWRTDVQRVLSCIDVYCLSSLWEALPFALLEAMAMSRPIVATSVDGVPEIVVDGKTGFLASPREPRVLAEGLVKLVRDPELRERMGAAGRRRAQAIFSVDNMVANYAELFREAARRGAS